MRTTATVIADLVRMARCMAGRGGMEMPRGGSDSPAPIRSAIGRIWICCASFRLRKAGKRKVAGRKMQSCRDFGDEALGFSWDEKKEVRRRNGEREKAKDEGFFGKRRQESWVRARRRWLGEVKGAERGGGWDMRTTTSVIADLVRMARCVAGRGGIEMPRRASDSPAPIRSAIGRIWICCACFGLKKAGKRKFAGRKMQSCRDFGDEALGFSWDGKKEVRRRNGEREKAKDEGFFGKRRRESWVRARRRWMGEVKGAGRGEDLWFLAGGKDGIGGRSKMVMEVEKSAAR